MEPEEENHFPNPDVGVQLRFLIFFGGVTNYIISEKRSPIHPPMMFWGYGRMADMWSFGCVVLEMGTASSPWGHPGNERVVWILYPIQSMKGQGKIDVIVQEPMMPHGDKISKATRSKHFSVTFGFSPPALSTWNCLPWNFSIEWLPATKEIWQSNGSDAASTHLSVGQFCSEDRYWVNDCPICISSSASPAKV